MKFCIIIGAQRSGTTSLYEYLCEHPEIVRCEYRKQTDFFTDDDHWARGPGWYRDQWNLERGQWALEASPSYTQQPHAPNAPRRMAQMDDRFRFVYVLRDPYERVRSYCHHARHTGELPKELPVGEALRSHASILETTRYASQVASYDAVFAPDAVHLLTLNELSERPRRALAEICEFLGVDTGVRFTGVDERYNDRDSHVEETLVLETLRGLEPVREAVRSWIPLHWRTRLKKMVSTPDEDVRYPELDDADRAYIRRELEEDLRLLREDDRVDVDHWSVYSEL